MNSTTELMRFLKSPFVERVALRPADTLRAYDLARKNKIALFYLDRLGEIGEIDGLENEYEEDMDRYRETSSTAVRLCSAINRFTDDFAVFKFLKPFPHTPSDVDVLFFLDESEFQRVSKGLTENGYARVAESPSQTVIYDKRGGIENMDTRSVGGKGGGRYYIDLYSDVSASHIIYLSNETLVNHRITIDTDSGPLVTLDPVADLCVVLAHSIIPERLFTMADCYTALYGLKQMTKPMIEELGSLFIKNNMTLACWHSTNLTAGIHMQAYGFVPEKLTALMDTLGINASKWSSYLNRNIELPYRFGNDVLFDVLIERLKNEKGFRSVVNQLMRSANPRLASWVISNWILRGNRETY